MSCRKVLTTASSIVVMMVTNGGVAVGGIKKNVLVSSSFSFDLLFFFPSMFPCSIGLPCTCLDLCFCMSVNESMNADQESEATPHFAKCLGLDLF